MRVFYEFCIMLFKDNLPECHLCCCFNLYCICLFESDQSLELYKGELRMALYDRREFWIRYACT